MFVMCDVCELDADQAISVLAWTGHALIACVLAQPELAQSATDLPGLYRRRLTGSDVD